MDDAQRGDLKHREKQGKSPDEKQHFKKYKESQGKTAGSLNDTSTELAGRCGQEWVEELVSKFRG